MSDMRRPDPLEVGLMFWTGGELGHDLPPAEIAASVRSLGVRCGQIGVHGTAPLGDGAVAAWRAAIDSEGLSVVTAFAGFSGESYASIPICAQTVGFVPRATREERERRIHDIVDFAAALGIPSLAVHIGCVSEDPDDPDRVAVRDLVRRVCDHCDHHGQTFALETGQESAADLLAFLGEVDRPNLGVNFDPANMILYGSGEPLPALELLKDHLLTVHCKDGTWPEQEGEWGIETPLGDGDVNMAVYVDKLRSIGYQGPLTIEREIVGEEQRKDIARAIALLNELRERTSA